MVAGIGLEQRLKSNSRVPVEYLFFPQTTMQPFWHHIVLISIEYFHDRWPSTVCEADAGDRSVEVWNAEGNPCQNCRFLHRTLTAAWQRGLGTKVGRPAT